jgi:hypothetical protein
MAGTFQPQPIQGNKLVDDNGYPTEAYRKWLDKMPPLLTVLNGDVPTTSKSAGIAGQITSDQNYLYVCTAQNTWKRVALSAF